MITWLTTFVNPTFCLEFIYLLSTNGPNHQALDSIYLLPIGDEMPWTENENEVLNSNFPYNRSKMQMKFQCLFAVTTYIFFLNWVLFSLLSFSSIEYLSLKSWYPLIGTTFKKQFIPVTYFKIWFLSLF